jgi:molecular chaperone HscC
MILGIDLGTTNSVCAYYGKKPDGTQGPILIRNSLQEVLTPSIVALNDAGQTVVGKIAREIQVVHPERCASVFKRYMGSEREITLGKQKFSAISLSALVLNSLKMDAEAALGHKVEEAVITVPAYFNDHARKATIEAGQLAGLKVHRILNEPTAAAIAYGIHEAQVDTTAIVIDLGGGTFDVSVIERFEGVLEIRSSSGESFLGGEDFTNALIKLVLDSQKLLYEKTEFESPKLFSRLRQQCEQAKIQLSRQPQYEIRIPNKKGEYSDDSPTFAITQAMFEQTTNSVLSRVQLPIMRALGDAKLTPKDMQQVILVGGATRMLPLQKLVREMFQQEPQCHLNPDEVVAIGAAIQAGIVGRNEQLDDYVVTDVAPHTMGIEVSKELGDNQVSGYFTPIINRNTTIPVSKSHLFNTIHPYQDRVLVRIFQGESRKVQDNHLLGEFPLTGFPASADTQSFSVRFTYDLNGILEVEATILATGNKVAKVINNKHNPMSSHEIKQALIAMQSLKVNYREDQANQYLLKRAERIYQEIPLDMRNQLEHLLVAFERALETTELDLITEVREQLNQFIKPFDGEADGSDSEF